MKPTPESSTQEVLAGLVERVTFHNGESGFCVLRAKARGLGSFAVAPMSEELAELENAVRACIAARDDSRAEILSSLHGKIRASLRGAERLRLDTDIDAQLCAEAFALQVGPRPYADPKILKTLREALLARVMVKFLYGEASNAALRWRKVVPYGLLFAPRFYLLAGIKSKLEPVLCRLDRIYDVEVTDEPGAPPESFDLEAYASRSLGVFQEEAEDIVLRFDPSAAPDARTHLFHPTYTMIDEADGWLTVSFRAAGLLQIAHHLMTFGPR
jgi:predicted DNA-binding transcriptional regulator YafY